MSEIKEAVVGLKNLLVQFQSMQKVAEVLDTIGNLEKAHSDSVVSINHYKKLEEEAKEQAVSAHAKLEVITQQIREAENQKKKILSDTLSEKQDIVNETNKEKDEILASTKKGVEAIDLLVKELRKESKELDEEISRKRGELEKIHLETTRLKNNLETFIAR